MNKNPVDKSLKKPINKKKYVQFYSLLLNLVTWLNWENSAMKVGSDEKS